MLVEDHSRLAIDRRSSRMICGLVGLLTLASIAHTDTHADDFHSDWDQQHDRIWIGPEYWANPLEDWRLRDGRLECTSPAPGRNVHLLTHQPGKQDGTLEMSVIVGLQQGGRGDGSVGFEIGISSELGDYRSSLIRGGGQRVVLTSEGQVLVGWGGRQPATIQLGKSGEIARLLKADGVRIRWVGETGDGGLAFRIHDPVTDELISIAGVTQVTPQDIAGNIALIHNPRWQSGKGRANENRQKRAKFWFRDLRVSGTTLVENKQQTFGPILYAMHTLSRGTMTMTAQMPPLGQDDQRVVTLEVPVKFAEALLRVPGVSNETESSQDDPESSSSTPWVTIARSTIDPLSCTAHFRVPHWTDTHDVPYRIRYVMKKRGGDQPTSHDFVGTVRKDPVDKPEIVVAGFTGHQDTAFPNETIARNVAIQNPDLLFFSGDQIYENAGGFGVIRNDAPRGMLSYLRKMWLWGWSFRDVLKDRPSFVLPDDHDVYQGNVWGEGGKSVPGGMKDHAQGGFAEPADFVNAVFRTQCMHHPPAYDTAPMMQGIDCWYGDCVYGRISFAVIEDRYFKSGPEGKVDSWEGRPDHVKDATFDTRSLDQNGLVLLGKRQLQFLDHWAADWKGADMKCVCSQTIFANVANYHGQQQEFIYGDLDSNGWPQTGRDKAVAAMRQAFAFHYTGDQHLPSIIQYGLDDWRDAGYSFCVPSTAAGYPRAWRPDDEGRGVSNRPPTKDHPEGRPNTGDYLDAFQNKVTVFAIGNPAKVNRKPVLEKLHDKSSGYGLVRFNKPDRTITMECYKLLFDAANPQQDDQFEGWPMTISMLDNGAAKPAAYLPLLDISGLQNPVVRVFDESTKSMVYTVRPGTTKFRPPVFKQGTYTIEVIDTVINRRKQRSRIKSIKAGTLDAEQTAILKFNFE